MSQPDHASPMEARGAEAAAFRRFSIYLFLFFLSAINYLDRIVLSVDARPIAHEFHLSPVAMGYLFSSFLWTYTVSQIPMGILADRWGSRGPIAAGIALWSLAATLTGTATSYLGIIACRLGLGIGEAVTLPAGGRVLRQWAPVRERGFAFAIFNSGGYAGPAFGAVLVATLTDLFGWRGAFLITGLIGFLWVAAWLIWFRRPEEAKWLGEAERAKILRERDFDDAAVAREGLWRQYLGLLRNRAIWATFLSIGCAVYTQYLFLAWLPTFLQTTHQLTMLQTGLFTALPYALAVLFEMVLSRISDRLLTAETARAGKRRLMIASLMGSCATVVVLSLFATQLWMVVILIGASLACIATTIALTFTLMTDLLRKTEIQGKAGSLLVIGGNCFGMIAPVVTGYVIAKTGGYNWAFVIAAILLVCGATIVLKAARRPIE